MSASNQDQLTLGIGLDDDATFENFLVSPANRQLMESLTLERGERGEGFITIWGSGSPGLTHLLQAACHQATNAGRSALYLPLREKSQLSPQILQGANTLSLVCIDDLDEIEGDKDWESALFTAFNEIRDADTQLIIAARVAPQHQKIKLPDLHSRLQSGLIMQLAELSDEEKLLALQLRASRRGIELANPVADYILQRAQRSLPALMDILDELDRSSLVQKRKLTIPLVKSTMNW